MSTGQAARSLSRRILGSDKRHDLEQKLVRLNKCAFLESSPVNKLSVPRSADHASVYLALEPFFLVYLHLPAHLLAVSSALAESIASSSSLNRFGLL